MYKGCNTCKHIFTHSPITRILERSNAHTQTYYHPPIFIKSIVTIPHSAVVHTLTLTYTHKHRRVHTYTHTRTHAHLHTDMFAYCIRSYVVTYICTYKFISSGPIIKSYNLLCRLRWEVRRNTQQRFC